MTPSFPNYDDVLAALTAAPLCATDTSKLECVSSLAVLKTGTDRVHSLKCSVCGEHVDLGIPVVCEFVGTWNQSLRGGREAVLRMRRHCDAHHRDEYVWWAVPTGGAATNDNESDWMDELMRYVLERAATKLSIQALRQCASNASWTLETKLFALTFLIWNRGIYSHCVLEYASSRIVNYKKLFTKSGLATIRRKAASHIESMTVALMAQCRQNAEVIFDAKHFDKCMNRLQLFYFQRGWWRKLVFSAPLDPPMFGLPLTQVKSSQVKKRRIGDSSLE